MLERAVLARACEHAPFLKLLADRHRDLVDRYLTFGAQSALRLAWSAPEGSVAVSLRRQRQRLALGVALGDLDGSFDLARVGRELSNFADVALDRAIGEAGNRQEAGSGARGFVALALGKHGGQELNYSSDIDPIFLYDPVTIPRRSRDDPAEAAARLAQTVVELLQRRDADGYVFRVDLRLRPAAEVTPPALPVDAAILHYESSALAWERAAFVRARAAAGAVELGQAMLAAVQPFIWRRSIDFGVVEEMRALTNAIRREYRDGQVLGPGYDLKRGRGGIRDVEFLVQAQQLVHGGRRPALRVGNTLEAIAALAAADLLPRERAARLAGAYRTLRTIEHRLQMIDDRQTHSLPTSEGELDQVGRLHGLHDGAELIELLAPQIRFVADLYDEFVPESQTALAAARNDDAISQRLRNWPSNLKALRSDAARDAFGRVLPRLASGLADAADPPAAVTRCERLLEGLPTALNLFRLLDARPDLLRTLVAVLVHAPGLAETLAARPALFDRLIDVTAWQPLPPLDELVAELGQASGYEAMLDRLRYHVGDYRFALGVQLVEGAVDPLDAAAQYARLAEAACSAAARAAEAEFAERHGRVPEGELAIIALGRLGGAALTHASDLDLVYLFTGGYLRESDGAKPLGATLYFNRLAARVSTALSAPTTVGALYPVDTRLRPSGSKGPLAVSVDSFGRYQREEAWIWEHMALTRARPIVGSAAARAAVSDIVNEVLGRAREPSELAREVVAMRDEMRRHKPPVGPLDVKLGEGGLVDLEFTLHFHQLASGTGLSPFLPKAIADLASGGFVPASLLEAHDLLTRLLVMLRLVAPDLQDVPEGSRGLVAKACRQPDWDALLAALGRARQEVSDEWRRVAAWGTGA